MRIALIIAALLAGLSALAQPITRNPWTTNSAVTVSNLTLGLIRDNGSIITNLNANNISSGTFSGNGSGLTNLYKSTNHVVAIAGANITLTTNSTGGVTAYTVASSGGGTPGGVDTQVQYNDVGAFGGDAGLTYNEATDTLTVIGTVLMGSGTVGDTLSWGSALGTLNGNGSIDATAVATTGNLVAQGTISAGPAANVILGDDGHIDWAGGLAILNASGGAAFAAAVATTGIFHGNGSGLTNLNSTNIIYPLLAFASATNSLVLTNSYVDFIATANVAVTNIVGQLANQARWATLRISNQTAAVITQFVTAPTVRAMGVATTNQLIIPAGKVGISAFMSWSTHDTNYTTLLQQ